MKLILPFNKCMMLCGFKNAEYKKYWGYPHYGIDISANEAKADRDIVASGDGTVLAAARDNTLGYGLAILYKNCESRNGEKRDLIARYMHMDEIYVGKGDIVRAGDKIAHEGKEGTGDPHLHFEIDTDTVYPTYSPQVSNNHTFWMKGIDSTVDPSLWLWVGKEQELVRPTYNPAWLNATDFDIPAVPAEDNMETDKKEENTMANEMIKLPINEEVPLYIGEDEDEAYGMPVWALVKKTNVPYGFITYDKYMRRTPCWWTDFGGEFVEVEDWEKLVPVSQVAQEYVNPREGKLVPTDTTNYDHLFDIPETPVEPDEPVEPETPVKPDEPVVEPGGTTVPWLKIFQIIIDLIKKIFSLFK